ncbi:MAG TPA: outer membrane protein [Bauldia sp.]|nr:outer membrane protein [Bauldia sp.]
MSRSKIIGASLLAIAAAGGSALAADVPSYEPPPSNPVYSPTPAFSWTGAYAGLFGGYNWGTANIGPAPTTAKPKGFLGGLYTGYNFAPAGNFLLGVEGDIFASGQKGADGAGLTVSNPWGATLRARAGLTFNRFLLYGTGGLAMGSIKASNAGGSDSQFKTGWTVGAGLEAALTDKLTTRIEYRYTDYGTASLATAPASTVDLHTSGVLVGVGLKF